MDELEFIKNRRKQEHRYGDVRKACEKVNVSPSVFQSAMRKTLIGDLGDKELLVIQAFLAILDQRKVDKELLKNSIRFSDS
jgi:hypothetical protein